MEQVIESTSASEVVTLEAADSPDESSTLRSGGREGCRESNVVVEDFSQYLHSFHTDAKYHWKLRDAISKSATRFRKSGWQRSHEGITFANGDFTYERYSRGGPKYELFEPVEHLQLNAHQESRQRILDVRTGARIVYLLLGQSVALPWRTGMPAGTGRTRIPQRRHHLFFLE